MFLSLPIDGAVVMDPYVYLALSLLEIINAAQISYLLSDADGLGASIFFLFFQVQA